MARVFWSVTAAAYLGCLVWGAVALPADGVPMHSDLAGNVDRYGTRTEFVWTWLALGLLLLVLMPLICVFSMRGDAPFLNLPNKDYWLSPERAAATKADVTTRLGWFLGAVNLLLVAGMGGTVVGATSSGAGPGIFPLVFALWIVYMVWWTIRFLRRYRRPRA